MNEPFKKFYLECLDTARDLYCGVKNDGYNAGGVDIRDYWQYGGVRDIAYMCHAKAKRLISLSSSGKKVNDCGIQDTCVDGINYFAFAYAEDKMRGAEAEVARPGKEGFKNSLSGKYPKIIEALQNAENAKALLPNGKPNPHYEALKTLSNFIKEMAP